MFKSWGNRFIEALEVDDDGNITDVIMRGEKMNCIPKICEALGVEVGEKFRILPLGGIYRFSNRCLEYLKETNKSCEEWIPSKYFEALVTGQYGIEKLPFEPKSGERYYYVYFIHNAKLEVLNSIWRCETADCQFKYCGNCFRTAEEAEAHKYEIYKKLTGREWGK